MKNSFYVVVATGIFICVIGVILGAVHIGQSKEMALALDYDYVGGAVISLAFLAAGVLICAAGAIGFRVEELLRRYEEHEERERQERVSLLSQKR